MAKGITREEEELLPDFTSWSEATNYFRNRFPDSFLYIGNRRPRAAAQLPARRDPRRRPSPRRPLGAPAPNRPSASIPGRLFHLEPRCR